MTPFYKLSLIAIASLTLSLGQTASAAPFDEVSTVSDTSLAGFQKVYIAPVTVELAETRTRRNLRDIDAQRPVSDKDKERRAKDTYKDVVQAFSKKFEIVDAPGADVLTIEMVVTKLVSSRATLADFGVSPRIDFSSTIYAGGADFDVRMSQGDTLLVEISDSNITNLSDGFPRNGTWQDYNRVSNRFARKLSKYVSEN